MAVDNGVRFLTGQELADRKRTWQGHKPVIYDHNGNILNRMAPDERIIEGGEVGQWNDTAPVDKVDGNTATLSTVAATKPRDPTETIDRVIEDVLNWVMAAKDDEPLFKSRIAFMRRWNPAALSHMTDAEVVAAMGTVVTQNRMQELTKGIYRKMDWDRGATVTADGATLPVGAAG